MKLIIAVLILLGGASGCGTGNHRGVVGAGEANNHEGFAPWPHPTKDQEYLEGFMDGYRGVRPLAPHVRDRRVSSRASSYNQGVADGYITGRRDEMQRR